LSTSDTKEMISSALAPCRSFLTGGELEQISVIFTLPSLI